MLSSLAFVGIPDIHQMNAVKSILAATMNGVSAIILAPLEPCDGITRRSWRWRR